MDTCVMEKTVLQIPVLTPSAGMWLTNGETCSKCVYLGVNDSADNWHEITEEEYNAIMAEVDAK